MDQITIEAQRRTALGKKVNALRREGITPFHVYGSTIESQSLQASTFDLVHALNEAGFTTPITVKVGSDEHFAIVRHIQKHPITDRLLHVDLVEISRTERIVAEVPVVFEGESMGARESGGQVSEELYQLEVEALPMEIPHELRVDLSVLEADDSILHAKDVVLPAGVTLVTDPDTIVARVVAMHAEEEEEEEATTAPAQEKAEPAEEKKD
jgi:large subunit ribosomal protein L25